MTVLNQAQRDREVAVAQRLTDLLIVNCRSEKEIVPPEIISHCFSLALQEENFAPDEGSARRILHTCAGLLKERRRVADRLNECILTSTEELLEERRAAKRARA